MIKISNMYFVRNMYFVSFVKYLVDMLQVFLVVNLNYLKFTNLSEYFYFLNKISFQTFFFRVSKGKQGVSGSSARKKKKTLLHLSMSAVLE